jgi:3-deoxy-D-manno-octulosonic-acid transferase
MIESAYRSLTQGLEHLPLEWEPTPHVQGAADLLLHGASAGEVRAASSWRSTLKRSHPGLQVVQTSGTASGLRMGAEARLPRDLPKAVNTLLDRVRPKSLILTEGELWPNLLRGAESRGIRVGVLGARMSARSLRMWSIIGPRAPGLLDTVAAWAATSQETCDDLLSLGISPEKVSHTGWLKWPAASEAPSTDARVTKPPGSRPLFVLGSLHPGELAALVPKLKGGPLAPENAHWLLVLRHPRKASIIRREATRLLPPGSWTLEARFGVQDTWYAQADAIFVGGGAQGRGVHDLLAPLAHGHPPLCFLKRGDPGSVGRHLSARGVAFPLDLPHETQNASFSTHLAASAALGQPTVSWAQLVKDFDGRVAATRFFQQRGLLP